MLILSLASVAEAGVIVEESSKTVHGLTVYIGFMPAEIVKGFHPPAHPERQMHGGVPGGAHEYHLIVAIYDAKTGNRISDASVSARVSPLGLSGARKTLEPMEIAGTTTYGQYFDLDGDGHYVASLEISRASTAPVAPVQVEFAFDHKPGHHP